MKIILLFTMITFCYTIGIRGIWFTVSGTKAPFTKEGIEQVVNKCKQVGINTIYFSVWDQSMVNFKPSQSLVNRYPFLKMNPSFSFDPLQYLTGVAHQVGIKVFAWFQYGFATSYNDPEGGPILKARPEWKSKDQYGNLGQKNKFQWMNGFDPEVQDFMINLVNSLGQSHSNIDGIQGDDRLPAMPSLTGYDQYTVSLYRAQHFGKQPPKNQKDDGWVDWRSNLLNDFMDRLSKSIRLKYPKFQIHMAPSIYPWSKYQYLQDWPSWVYNKQVDAILPQVYRYSTAAYADTIQQNLQYLEESQRDIFYPGILIGVGSNTTVNAKILADCLAINKALKIKGESYFYHESLNDVRVAETIATYYRSNIQ